MNTMNRMEERKQILVAHVCASTHTHNKYTHVIQVLFMLRFFEDQTQHTATKQITLRGSV